MGDFEELVSSLGFGDVPIANDENKILGELLAAKHLETKKLEYSLKDENEQICLLHNHFETIQSSLKSTKHFIQARKEVVKSEKDLESLQKLQKERCKKEDKLIKSSFEEVRGEVGHLEEKIGVRHSMLEILDEEFRTDMVKIEEWERQESEFDDHIMALLRCQHQDSVVIKRIHLDLEKLKDKADAAKTELNESFTANKMSQRALDKVAAEYRQIHEERQDVLQRWHESMTMTKKRESHLAEFMEKMNKIKEDVEKKSKILKEQISFKANEVKNCGEVRVQVNDAEQRVERLKQELIRKENEFDHLDAELVLEERETMKLGADIAMRRTQLKELQTTRNRIRKRVGALTEAIQLGKRKKSNLKEASATAEDRVNELNIIISKEEAQRDKLQWDLDRTREVKFKREHQLKQIAQEEEALRIQLKAWKTENGNLTTRLKLEKEELIQREDTLMSLQLKLTKLEREIALLKGIRSTEQRCELKAELEKVKDELAFRETDLRSSNHLLHKVQAETRKLAKSIVELEKQLEDLNVKADGLTKSNESEKQEQALWQDKLESLLLEEKILQVNEHKIKDELKVLHDSVHECERHAITSGDEKRKEKSEMEKQKDLLFMEEKHLREDLKLIKGEIRERIDCVRKLEAKYDLLIKSLGEVRSFGNASVPSHAYHLIQLAQDRAEFQEQSELLKEQISRKEQELTELRKAMAIMKNSNEKYRAINIKTGVTATQGMRDLLEKVQGASDEIERLQNELDTVNGEIQAKEMQIFQLDSELNQGQQVCEEKRRELDQVVKELKDQELKLFRAEKVVRNLSQSLRATNTSSDLYEKDMDLRLGKETQRTALIKLRELSLADNNFSVESQRKIEKLGIKVPTVSRLELQVVRRSASANRLSRGLVMSAKPSSGGSSLYRSAGLRRSSSTSNVSSSSSASQIPKSMLTMDLTNVRSSHIPQRNFVPVGT